MFSEELREYAQQKYDGRMQWMGAVQEAIPDTKLQKDSGRMGTVQKATPDMELQKGSSQAHWMENLKTEIQQKMKTCTPEEQILMKFFYGTMPFRDMGEYEFEVFLGFVRHGLMVYEAMEWCRELPEEIFLQHVLYYRINSEHIEDCRRFFYGQLIDRIRGKTPKEAVLEINYWCAEHGTYEASDIRTISPMAMYRSGKGRCGEESTFAVTAFRSVGIPARQVYVPKWAHCEDNHAWVEVYVEGNWHFLGACEPEEVLDRGWFVNASSRAMMVHAREFSDYGNKESCFRQGEIPYYRNVTARYAKTREFPIKVIEEDGTPAENARVFVEVLNSAEYGSIAVLDTDSEGRVSLCLGIGTLHLWAVKEGRTSEALIDMEEQKEALLTLKERNQKGTGTWVDMDIKAPKETLMHPVHLTKEQKAKNRERIQEAAELRAQRIEGYYEETLADKYPKEKELLTLAAGNFSQLYQFLERDDNPARKELLHSLCEKDYRDAREDVLEHHLKYASKHRAEWAGKGELELYEKYILCPRIYFEEMTCYRKEIQDFFSAEEKEQFKQEPEKIWSYIKANIRYDENYDYSTIFSTPVNTLRLRFGNPMSQRILCAAICRTLGIPARLDQAAKEVEVYRDGSFVRISGIDEKRKLAEKVTLTLKRKKEEWKYYQNWTIGQFRQGNFVTLDYQGLEFEGMELKLELEPGYYRILAANRLPNGDQLASECKICLERGYPLERELNLRTGSLEELLVSNQLEDFEVIEDGERTPISTLTEGGVHILAFLEPGEEPTEHVLNEIAMQQESIKRMEAGICFIVRNQTIQKTAAWEKAVQAFPEVKLVYGSLDELTEPLARKMYVDPEKLPLLIILNPGLLGIYACSGYHAGSVKLMLELLRVNQEQS